MNDYEISSFDLQRAYKNAMNFAHSHYENFPVISYFLPFKMRKHIAVVYQFARQADDIADEGEFTESNRIELLEQFKDSLEKSLAGIYNNEFWFALSATIQSLKLTPENFLNLLSAFRQDVTKRRYKNYYELNDYCRRSANPVGRIILEMYNIRDNDSLYYSDQICTALQLTNFLQDVSVDIGKGRIYLPLDELHKFEISKKMILESKQTDNFKDLMKFQIIRVKEMFKEGRNLLNRVPFRLRMQLKLTILGGEKILEKIEMNDYNVLAIRPFLKKTDYLKILINSFTKI